MDIDKQRVIILGGTSGIGYATAEAAAAHGAEVVIVSSNAGRVREAAGRLGVTGRVADLTELPPGFFADLGDFDHLVYTAGEPLPLMPVADLDLDRARGFFGLRYFGALAAVRAAVPRLRPGGSITLTTGTAGDRPLPGWSVAASVCGAVVSLTRALAVELAPIRVNAVQPGVTRSPMWGADAEQVYASMGAGIPLGRVGSTAEVAQAYLYLMTQTYATGTILTVDGGGVLV
jgi:NAD(P)-dependent dehydrogenase (short-subunit alcohol dehydrogenase family)